ncbi:MAG: hypothetical protein K0R43_3110 [Pseudoduganella sp.]|jgi:hypothetical protein|nr:hypothetical protein [Pseudoduganella sp.]
MSDKLKDDPPVIHCKVTVKKVTNKDGSYSYKGKFDPEVLKVTENDTVLSFKLKEPTPDDVRIESINIKQLGQSQLSQPSISKNRKFATLTDVNTVKETLNLSFKFGPPPTNPTLKVECADEDESDVYPEVDNDPPVPPA